MSKAGPASFWVGSTTAMRSKNFHRWGYQLMYVCLWLLNNVFVSLPSCKKKLVCLIWPCKGHEPLLWAIFPTRKLKKQSKIEFDWSYVLRWWMLRSVTQCASQKCLHSANRRIRVLLHSFFQGWNKLNMSYRVSKYFSCGSNVSIVCKPVRVFLSKWQPWLFVPA